MDLDCALDDDLIRGGYAREMVRHIQNQRKVLDFSVTDRIVVRFSGDPELLRAATDNRDYIMRETLAKQFLEVAADSPTKVAIDSREWHFSIEQTKG